MRNFILWTGIISICLVPLGLAATSPYLQWRDPVYIASGFAGISALVLLFVQPLLIGNIFPGIGKITSRRMHQWVGSLVLLAVIIHVAGLWITSPPDVVDALLLNSPTPFSLWGVIAMWMVLIVALLALFKRRMKLRPRTWRFSHLALTGIIVTGTVIHTLLIEGTMEFYSKIALCVFAALAYLLAVSQAWFQAKR